MALTALVIILLVGSGSASARLSADSPVSVNGPITDTRDVLGDRTDEVRGALDDYFDATGRQLFVVFVPTFDGLAGQDWATASAARSDLASQDILLAVATEDRAYGYSVDDEQQLSDDDLQRVERDAILPRLRQEDWAGAAIAAARGYADAGEGDGFPWIPVGLGGAVVAGAGALVVRNRRRGDASTGDLDRQCAAALVRVDNTLTTSEQELAFAEAQFGTEATQPFRRVLTEARQTTQAAFALRQQLDDGQPESPAEHQRIATEILALCDTVETTIAAQVAGFDTLRDLQANAPDLLAAVPARAAEITQRLTTSRAVLARLRADHPQSALASIEGNVDQAERLAAESVQQAGLGSAAVAAEDRATAVVHARAAEEALGQATTLLDALDRADADIDAAPQQIAERIAAIGQDLDDAARLGGTDPAVAAAIATAREAVTLGRPGRSRPAHGGPPAADRRGRSRRAVGPSPSGCSRSGEGAGRAERVPRPGHVPRPGRQRLHRHSPRRGGRRRAHPAVRGRPTPRHRPGTGSDRSHRIHGCADSGRAPRRRRRASGPV